MNDILPENPRHAGLNVQELASTEIVPGEKSGMRPRCTRP
jgi:hypothetical protein